MSNPWHLYALSTILIIAGTFHFVKPKIYMRIMPRYLPAHKQLVYLSGLAEILLGILLLFEATRKLSAIGIILMLIIFLSVHFYMLSGEKAAAGFPRWLLILRIPLQILLMFWVFQYT